MWLFRPFSGPNLNHRKGCQMDWRVILTIAVTGLAIILESLTDDDQ
jgi:hypothetical protein